MANFHSGTPLVQLPAFSPAWQPDLFGPVDEASLYHDSDRWGFFSLLYAADNGKDKYQRTYPLVKLAWVIEHADPSRDTWISQGEFLKFNRRVVNLLRIGVCFADLDTYKSPVLAGVSPAARASLLIDYCDGEGIPIPSVVLDSGRGLCAKWILRPVVSRRALPYWNAVQQQLLKRLHRFGGDFGARDASRVLRLVGVVNTKSGTACRVLHVAERDGAPISYELDHLGDALFPISRAEIRRRREERRERPQEDRESREARSLRLVPGTGSVANLRSFSGPRLAWDRLLDLRHLLELRYGDGPVDEGLRMKFLFWELNFLLLSGATNPAGMWHEAAELARRIDPSWGYGSAELGTLFRKAKQFAAGEKVEFGGREYPALYTPRNDTLIQIFEITDAERHQLATIVSADEARRRDAERKRARRARAGVAREVERQELAQTIVRLRDVEKMTWRQIESQVPVSVGKAFALYAAFKKASVLLGGVGDFAV